MPVEERLGGLAWIGLHKAGIRLRQVHAQEVDLLAHPADHADRLAKIYLRMARRVCQRHERLAPSRPAEPDMVLHHRISAGKAMLVAQPFEDPLGRMPLLHRRCPVSLQDRIDHRQQRPQLRLRRRLLARISRWQREPAHLGHRLPVEPENPRRLATAVTLHEHKAPNGGITLHAKHPRPLPKEAALPTAGFYSAPLAWNLTGVDI